MIGSLAALVLSVQGSPLDNHYLIRLVSDRNFQYQAPGYCKPSFKYYGSTKEVDQADSKAIAISTALLRVTTIELFRKSLRELYDLKERSLGRDANSKISGNISTYFANRPEMAKALSRQDVCVLVLLDNDLSYIVYPKSMVTLLRHFKDLTKKDFESLDVALAFLRLANSNLTSGETWKYEREEWALGTAGRLDAMGSIAVGLRSYRLVAEGVRKRSISLIDQGIGIQIRAKKLCFTEDDLKGIDDNVKYLTKQRALLLKRLK